MSSLHKLEHTKTRQCDMVRIYTSVHVIWLAVLCSIIQIYFVGDLAALGTSHNFDILNSTFRNSRDCEKQMLKYAG